MSTNEPLRPHKTTDEVTFQVATTADEPDRDISIPSSNLLPLELNIETEAKDQHKPTPTNQKEKNNVNKLNEAITDSYY